MISTVFSLVILTYERSEPLRCCLESIVQQDFDKSCIEVIIVDDGSQVDNKPIIEFFRSYLEISYIYQENQGVVKARNTGIKHAQGRFVAFIADDYQLPRNYLTEAQNFFNSYSEAQVLTFNILSCGKGFGKNVQQLYTQLALWRKIEDEDRNVAVIKSAALPASRAAVFKREVFEQVGMFNENIHGGEDSDLTLRLSQQKIPVYFLPEVYINHWEQKSFFDFLNQRYRYGGYSFEIQKASDQESQTSSPVVFFLFKIYFYKIPCSLFSIYCSLLCTAKKTNKCMVFVYLTPFILLFIFSYLLGFYVKALHFKDARKFSSKLLH